MKKLLCLLLAILLVCCGCATENPVEVEGATESETIVTDDTVTPKLLLFKDKTNSHIYDILEKGFIAAAEENEADYAVNEFTVTDFIKGEGSVFTDVSTELDLMDILIANNNSHTGVYCHMFKNSRYRNFLAESEILCAEISSEYDEMPYCDLFVNDCTQMSIYEAAVNYINNAVPTDKTVGFIARVGSYPLDNSTENKAITTIIENKALCEKSVIAPVLWTMDTDIDTMVSDLRSYITENNIDVLVSNIWVGTTVLEEIKTEFPELRIVYLSSTITAIETVEKGVVEAVVGTDCYEMGYKIAAEMISAIKGKKQPDEISLEPVVISTKQQATEYLIKIS